MFEGSLCAVCLSAACDVLRTSTLCGGVMCDGMLYVFECSLCAYVLRAA